MTADDFARHLWCPLCGQAPGVVERLFATLDTDGTHYDVTLGCECTRRGFGSAWQVGEIDGKMKDMSEEKQQQVSTQIAWAQVVNNLVEGAFWLGFFALCLRACGNL